MLKYKILYLKGFCCLLPFYWVFFVKTNNNFLLEKLFEFNTSTLLWPFFFYF